MTANSSIAFTMDPSGHIFVHAHIAGRTVATILDTGAGLNVIDAALAHELGLTLTSGSESAGMTGNIASARVTLPPIVVGDVQLPSETAAVVDMSPISGSTGSRVDLVLGRRLFETFQVDLDFDTLRVDLRMGHVSPAGGVRRLPLTTSERGRLYTLAGVESSRLLNAMYDLGSGVPLYISSDLANLLGIFDGRPSSRSATIGAEGLTVSRVTTLKCIRLGDYVLRNVPVQVPDKWNQRGPVSLGVPILRRFRNVIDLQTGELWLSPGRNVDEPFPRDRSGIGAQRLTDRLRVVFVAPGSPALLAGLKPGDEIVTIDGAPCGPGLYSARPRPGAEAVGTVQHLGLSSGATVTITLRDYF